MSNKINRFPISWKLKVRFTSETYNEGMISDGLYVEFNSFHEMRLFYHGLLKLCYTQHSLFLGEPEKEEKQ